jgi:hypothetical protein
MPTPLVEEISGSGDEQAEKCEALPMNDEPERLLEWSKKDSRVRRALTTAYFVGAIVIALALIAVVAWLYGT